MHEANFILFLSLTFAISFVGFLCIVIIPGAQSPDKPKAIPFWLLTVWGPSLSAIFISLQNDQALELLKRVIQISTVPPEVWLLIALPLLLLFILARFAKGQRELLSMKLVIVSIAFNLILGPLGEELGWRGYMQEHLNSDIGWLEASLIIGVMWYIWHWPLWLINSPQSQISIYLFGLHCMIYSIIIGAAYTLSEGSLLPAILIHLTVNLAANWSLFMGMPNPNDWFRISTLPYFSIALFAIILVYFKLGVIGLDRLLSLF